MRHARLLMGSETGSATIASLLLALVLFGFTAALVSYSLTDTRAVSAEVSQANAFYLAEAGLEAAKKEMINQLDASGDGMGDIALTTDSGSYSVSVNDIGGGYFELISTGHAGDDNVMLRQVIEEVPNPAFPIGAVSVVGATDKTKLQFKNDSGMVIDGDDQPGLVFTEQSTFDEAMEDITAAIEAGKLPPQNITGSESTSVTLTSGETEEVSVTHEELTNGGLSDLTDLYTELVDDIGDQIPAATPADFAWSHANGVESYTAGSAASPVLWGVDGNAIINNNDTLTGHGTMLITDRLTVENNATVNWTGDIMVFGDDSHRPRVTIDGNLNLNGNLIILGAGDETAELWFKSHSTANIEGSIFMGTHYDEAEARRTRLMLDGTINLTGMFSAFGSMIDISFFTGSNFNLTGMAQLGFVDSPGNTTLKMHFNGNSDFQKDDDAMILGLKEMRRMARSYSITHMEDVITFGVADHSWSQVPYNGGYGGVTQGSP